MGLRAHLFLQRRVPRDDARICSRADDGHKAMPAAALTAYARTVDRARSLRAGFQMHLTKPMPATDLTAAVDALARGRLE